MQCTSTSKQAETIKTVCQVVFQTNSKVWSQTCQLLHYCLMRGVFRGGFSLKPEPFGITHFLKASVIVWQFERLHGAIDVKEVRNVIVFQCPLLLNF